MNKNIVIIGGSEQQLSLVQKSKECGLITHVFDYDLKCVCSDVADYFYPISIYEPFKVLEVVRKINPISVQSIASEVGNKTANFVANKLKLITNSYTTVCLTTDKVRMKRRLMKCGVPTPRAYFLYKNSLDKVAIEYPFMVKASDRTGGRGIRKVNNLEEFKIAYDEAKETSFNKQVIVEEYFEGKQFSVEMISFNGLHSIVGITEQFYSGFPHFVECQDLMQARVNFGTYEKIRNVVMNALDALKVKFGASHVELRVNNNNEVKVIEVASRMGGGFRNELVEISTGNDYVKMLIDISLGKKPFVKKNQKRRFSLLKWICDNNDLDIYKKIKNNYNDLIVRERISDANETFVAKNGTERKGYYILQFSDPVLVDRLLER